MKEFYRIGSKLLNNTFQAHPEGLINEIGKINIQWELLCGNYRNIQLPVNFSHKYGNKMMDILDTGWPSLYLISDKCKELLSQNNISGYLTYSINLTDKNKNKINGYSGLSIKGLSKSYSICKDKVVYKKFVDDGLEYKYYRGIKFDEYGWDGSDIFLTEGSFEIFSTKKLVDLFNKNGITNFKSEAISEIDIAFEDIDIMGINL